MEMSIFNFFQGKKNSSTDNTPRIEFGFRGEGIIYQLPNKSMELWSTWVNGMRVYTETISKWKDGSFLTTEEKKQVFTDVIRFVEKKAEKPIIVVSADDPSKRLWEELCGENQPFIKNIEYTSREEQHQVEYKMYLDFIRAGKKVTVDGFEISNENDLDKFIEKRRKNQAAYR